MAARTCVIVGGASALEFWRREWFAGNGFAGGLRASAFPDDLLAQFAACPSLLDGYPRLRPAAPTGRAVSPGRLGALLGVSLPVDVVVEGPSARQRPAGVVTHVWSRALVEGLVIHIEDDLYVCSPELAFAQVAARSTKAALLELAFELCGDYVRLDGAMYSGRHLGPKNALSSPDRLRAVCGLLGGFKGAQRARLAADVVVANSWSPRESQLAAVMTLSRAQGGYGCPAPLLNERIYLDEETAAIAKRGYLVPDILYLGAGLCLEYQGGQHDAAGNRVADDAKSNVLLMMGIETVRVWDAQLYDTQTMDAVAAHAYKKLGIRRGKPSLKMIAQRSDLLDGFRASSRRR